MVITYKIYTKVQISGINISKAPAFPGFWSQNLTKDNDKLQPTTQMINGEQYLVADIRKYSLFALKTGYANKPERGPAIPSLTIFLTMPSLIQESPMLKKI